MSEIVQEWSQRIQRATASKTPLRFRGGGTKDFYSQSLEGEILDTRAYTGILSYEPSELDRKSTRLNSSHSQQSRMPSSA